MPNIIITGANRGIGLEFAQQYCRDGWDVIATVRQPTPELAESCVRVAHVDMADADVLADFAASVDRPIDLLIANAGTNHPMQARTAEDARDWQTMMMVNVISPYLLARALLPQLKVTNGKAIAISSGMGSVAENSGGWIPYRTSKAALNMAWSSLALEGQAFGVTAAVLSPGWVQTRMGGAGAEITAEESVSAMRQLIERLTLVDTGKFMRRDGSELPW